MMNSGCHFKHFVSGLLFLMGLNAFSQENDTSILNLPLNEFRILASHNSYKKRPDPQVIAFLDKFKKRLGDDMDPNRMDYGHLTLSQQFSDYGIRGVELDVYYDPKGGRYTRRRINLFVKNLKQRSDDPKMKLPGFKMLHIADIDYESHYATFIDGLKEIKVWSDQHPEHTPIFINIEPKTKNPGDYSGFLRCLGFKKAVKFDLNAYEALDKEILSVFNQPDQLISPKDLRGNFSSVSERIDSIGWPELKSCLGKVFFIIDGDPKGMYEESLAEGLDRPMFVYSDPNKLNTAFVKRNDPVQHEQEISELSNKYIVRTRTDVETMEARHNDYTMFNAAIESNAQILSTDFYKPDARFGSFYISLDKWKNSPEQSFILRKKENFKDKN